MPSLSDGMPLTPITPLTTVKAAPPAGERASIDEPTVAARREDLLD